MKKSYINPSSKLIQLSAEESMLTTVSGNGTVPSTTPEGFGGVGGENTGGNGYTGDLTNRGNSIWENWTD